MGERGSVKLVLAPGARIPEWVWRGGPSIQISFARINKRVRRTLEVTGGKAWFIGRGAVDVELPGLRRRGYIAPLKVLQITESSGEIIRNRFFCDTCVANTGKLVSHKPSEAVGGLQDGIFGCTQCKVRWEQMF